MFVAPTPGVRNAARLLKQFSSRDRELGVSELARRLDLGKSTVHRLLVTLTSEHLLEQDPLTGKYRLGLAMHDLGIGSYYGYLLLYIAVFLIDDTAIFVIAMLTLRATFASAAISRVSHLVGGIVLLILGAVMLLRPDLLG